MKSLLKDGTMTVRDVAQYAKVSVASVSRALNDPKSVRPTTLSKVQDAVGALGYSPNSIARSLKTRKTHLVGIVIPDILNPFFARVVKGVEETVGAQGYTAIICDSEEKPEKEKKYVLDLFERRADGLVTIPSRENSEILILSQKRNVPVVFVDRFVSQRHDSIRVSNLKGVSLLMSHLVDEGCQRIGFVGGPTDTLPGRERLEGYQKLLSEYHLMSDERFAVIGDFSVESGFQLMNILLRNRGTTGLDAVIVGNNLMGIGAVRALKEAGVKVPREMAIGVFDDISLADVASPSITVVAQPDTVIGQTAGKMLLERMSGQLSIPPREVVLEPQLIVRDSSRRRSLQPTNGEG